MLVHFLKFFHIVVIVGLLGLTLSGLFLISFKKFTFSQFNPPTFILLINKSMLILMMLAVMSGTFLVYPKQFTFHTPWIQAAYLLTFLFSLILVLLFVFKKKYFHPRHWMGIYLILLTLLMLITHDAITKTTFFK